jgi:hypothetical protein
MNPGFGNHTSELLGLSMMGQGVIIPETHQKNQLYFSYFGNTMGKYSPMPRGNHYIQISIFTNGNMVGRRTVEYSFFTIKSIKSPFPIFSSFFPEILQ